MDQPMLHPKGNQPFVLQGGRQVPLLAEPISRPAYLIRNSDGKVFAYSQEMALDGANFTPSNTLPQYHIAEIEAARAREEEVRKALLEAEAKQAARDELKKIEHQKLLDGYLRTQRAEQPKLTQEEQLKLDESVVLGRDLKGLQDYAQAEFGVTVAGNLTQLREQVRLLQGHRRKDLPTSTPAPEVPAATPETTKA